MEEDCPVIPSCRRRTGDKDRATALWDPLTGMARVASSLPWPAGEWKEGSKAEVGVQPEKTLSGLLSSRTVPPGPCSAAEGRSWPGRGRGKQGRGPGDWPT